MIDVVCGLVLEDGRCLLVQRPPGGRHGGLWEFPGGKVEAGESHVEALARELEEELGIRAQIGRCVAQSDDGAIRLFAYRVEGFCGAIDLRVHAALRWIEPLERDLPAMPAGDREIWAQTIASSGV
jgi:(d)CTP diphosphatase